MRNRGRRVLRRSGAVLGALAAIGLAGCARDQVHYAAEVGYYNENRAVEWDVFGDFTSFDTCKEQAVALYTVYQTRGREFSWACLLKNEEGGYSGRFR